jgi:hypothetical protein
MREAIANLVDDRILVHRITQTENASPSFARNPPETNHEWTQMNTDRIHTNDRAKPLQFQQIRVYSRSFAVLLFSP